MSWIILAVVLVASIVIGLAGLFIVVGVVMWFVRRRRAATTSIADEKTFIKPIPPRAPASSTEVPTSPGTPAAPLAAAKSATPPGAVAAAPPPAAPVTPSTSGPRTAGAAKATPAPVTPSSVLRSTAGGDAPKGSPLDTKSGFAPPPPPPPFQPIEPSPKKSGPLIGFFDDDKGEEVKTEVFSREHAKRYAKLLKDEEDAEKGEHHEAEGDHTELFSASDMSAEVAALLEEDNDPPDPKAAPKRG